MMVMAVSDSSPLLLDEGLSPTRLRKLEDWTGHDGRGEDENYELHDSMGSLPVAGLDHAASGAARRGWMNGR